MGKNYILLKQVVYLALVWMISIQASSAQLPQFYNGDPTTGSNSNPFAPPSSNRCQFLYRPTDFNTAPYSGTISKLYFKSSTASVNPSYTDFTIKMGMTNLTQFASGTWYSQPMNTVLYAPNYTINQSISVDTWVEISLPTPFYYDGVSNIVIEISHTSFSPGFSSRTVTSPSTRVYGAVGSASPSGVDGINIAFGMDIVGSGVNNAGMMGVVSPVLFCAGLQNIEVLVGNFGRNVINNVDIHWELDGVPQSPVSYNSPIDTIGSVNGSTASIVLGSHNFTGGAVQLKAWTSNPNGVLDTVNMNDTIYITLHPSLSGVYTIDQGSPTSATNFASFNDFSTALSTYGVCGPVVANVNPASGLYNEYLSFGVIPGVSPTNSVRINGNGAQVEYATTSSERQLLTLAGTKYLRIDNLNFKTTTTTNFAWGALLMQGAEYDSITNCSFDLSAVSSTASVNSNGIVFSNSVTSATGAGVNGTNCYIAGNHLIGPAGAAGMYYGIAIASGGSHNNTLLDNEIENYYSTGIYLNGAQNTLIEGNRLHNSTKTATFTTNYGIYTVSSDISGTRILKNRIYSPAGTGSSTSLFRGLYLLGDGSSGSSVLVANNLIYDINQGGASSGIYLDGATYNKVYHNTINFNSIMTGTSANYGIYATGTNTGLEIKNNIVSITEGSGGVKYGFYYSSAASISNAQRNNFYVNSNQSGTQNYGYYTTAYATITAFQTAYPTLEVGSTNVDPLFANIAIEDYTPMESALFLAGMNVLSDVADDINGLPRTTTPTVGAFQRGAQGADNAGVNALVELNGDFCSGTQDVNIIIANNGTNIINSLTVQWEANGVAQTPYNYTGVLDIIGSASGNLDTITIGQYNFPAGVPTNLTIWTSNPNGNLDLINLDDTLSVVVQPTVFSVSSLMDTLCMGDSIVVSLVNNIQQIGIQWESSIDGVAFNSVGASGNSYTAYGLMADEWYRTEISVNGNTCYSDTVVVRVVNPQIVSVTNDTICGVGTAVLSVTGSTGSDFNWYENPVGGSPIGTGASFTTPLLTATDTFYVAAASAGGAAYYSVGYTTSSNYSFLTQTAGWGAIFRVDMPCVLDSVAVFPTGTGTVQIQVLDLSNNLLFAGPVVNVTGSGTQKIMIPVGAQLSLGNYKLGQSSSGITNLGSEPTGSTFAYPFTSPALTITSGTQGSGAVSAVYYWFYDWKVRVGSSCESPREMAIAVVTPPPTISASATQGTICKGSTTDLNVTSSHPGYTYEWQPINQSGASITVSPDTTTAYVVWAEDLTTSPFAGCIAVDTVLVTVDSILTPIVLTTPDTLCGGDTTHVSVNMPITKDFGAGALVGLTSSSFNPFFHTWGGAKSQYLILASELTAAGLTPGTIINSLSVEFTSATGYVFNDFALSIGHTTQTALNTTLITTGLNQVFSAPGIQPFAGINTIVFANNFVWDGVSNIVVQTCWSNNNTGSTANAPLIKYDNTPFVSNVVYRVDNQLASFVCGASTGSTTNSNRPWFRLGVYEQSSNYTYQWASIGGTASNFVDVPTNYTSSPVQQIYSVTVTGANNCTAVVADTVVVNPQPTAVILSDHTVICSNDVNGFFIDGSSSLNETTYLWLADGSTAPSYKVEEAGTYILEVSNAQGCRDWDTIVITEVTPVIPVISINYQGSQVVLDAGPGYASYLWNTLEATQTIVVTNSGQYSVTVEDTNGCSASSAPVNLSISVKEWIGAEINLFPNPSNGQFVLSIADFAAEDLRIDVYDLSGRMMHQQLIKEVQPAMQIAMDLSTVEAGVYLLRLSTKTSSTTLRFTVVK